MDTVQLTVHSAGNNLFRFYISVATADKLKICRGSKFEIELENGNRFEVRATCGKPCNPDLSKTYKKGYDLYHKEINRWIQDKEFHNTRPILTFRLEQKAEVWILISTQFD